MKPYGKTIREIRLSKGLSQKEIYSGLISKTYAIEFEKGHHDMTFSLITQVLKRLRVGLTEFEYIHNGYQKQQLSKKYSIFVMGANNRDKKVLLDLLATLSSSKKDSDRLLSAQVILTLHRLSYDDTNYPEKEVTIIHDYLMQVETWTLEELNLFTNSLIYFSYPIQKVLVQTAVKSAERFKDFNEYDLIYTALLMNFLANAFLYNDVSTGKYYLSLLEVATRSSSLSFQRSFYIYYGGILLLHQGEQVKGRGQCQTILNYFRYLNFYTLVETTEKYLDETEQRLFPSPN